MENRDCLESSRCLVVLIAGETRRSRHWSSRSSSSGKGQGLPKGDLNWDHHIGLHCVQAMKSGKSWWTCCCQGHFRSESIICNVPLASLSACNYCNGICNPSANVRTAGVQLSDGSRLMREYSRPQKNGNPLVDARAFDSRVSNCSFLSTSRHKCVCGMSMGASP